MKKIIQFLSKGIADWREVSGETQKSYRVITHATRVPDVGQKDIQWVSKIIWHVLVKLP